MEPLKTYCRCKLHTTDGEVIDVGKVLHRHKIEHIRRDMWEAAQREDYEKAAQLRDQINKIETEK